MNVDATQWNYFDSPTWNCNAAGTTTIDSNAGTVTSTSCALGTLDVTNGVSQTTGGSTVMVVRLQGLTVTNGHLIQLKGDKPIVFLVAGNVVIDTGGMIDASANGATAGPGGSIATQCTGSTGGSASSKSIGGGGGGFGTAGGYGAKVDGSSGSAGGAVSAITNLQPLRGGCSGGAGGGSDAGAGGGAFEISASGTITIGHSGDTATTTGTLSAAGGYSLGATGTNSGSGGAGSGGGILLVSPATTAFGTSGAVRVHGGGSGSGRGINSNGKNGTNGHTADNTAAAGGAAPDINGAAGVKGGLCAGNGCSVASAVGANGTHAAAGPNLDGSGGGGGGGRVQTITAAATPLVCN